MLAANSDVPPKAPAPKSTVAVALTTWPTATLTDDNTEVNEALPKVSVVTLAEPRKTFPPPLPLASPTAELKYSTRNVVFAVLFKEAMTVVLPPVALEDNSTGKFWPKLLPTSASLTSFVSGIAPPFRLIARAPLPKIEFPSIATPVVFAVIRTPAPATPD